MVSQGYIIGPNIKLPLHQTQYSTVHPSSVDANSHVHIYGHYLPHQTAKEKERAKRANMTKATQYKATTGNCVGVYVLGSTHAIASIISSPISTAQ